jgi:hypothetical protein
VDERDVEVGSIVAAEREIDESIGPRMATFEDHRTSVDWPLCSIGVGYGLVNSATWNKAFWLIPDQWREISPVNIHGLSHCVEYELPLQYGFLKCEPLSDTRLR